MNELDCKNPDLQKRKYLKSVQKTHELKLNGLKILESLVMQCSDPSGVVSASIDTITWQVYAAESVSLCDRTVRRWLNKLVDLGILHKKRGVQSMTKRNHNPSNIYTLIGYNHIAGD